MYAIKHISYKNDVIELAIQYKLNIDRNSKSIRLQISKNFMKHKKSVKNMFDI